MTTSASRKCDITASGWRSSSTVTPPSGIWATVPRNATSAVVRTQRGSPSTLREASQHTSAITMPTSATIRFPNSMNAWYPWAGNGVWPQRGQFSQPSPEPVRRTNAPDVTTNCRVMNEANAMCRNRVEDTVRAPDRLIPSTTRV